MPIYEFRCVKCGNIEEVLFISSKEEIKLHCNQCGGEEFERIVSRTSHFVKTSFSSGEGPSLTSRSCSPGSSCSTITLPGYTK
ncbi:MAG: zinc ribbon domain-containing protein [Syntrophobacterales bacterium]|nr:zinc ribbon domain-containing protein [Syntrophobacterales bacterium]